MLNSKTYTNGSVVDRFITTILRLFIMTFVVFFTLSALAFTILMASIMTFLRFLGRRPPNCYTNKRHTRGSAKRYPLTIEGQYRVIDS